MDNLIIERRRIVAPTQGRRHGPITRVVSPSDLGERIKPFVFLDWFDAPPAGKLGGGIHPHSGIATITVLLQGDLQYEDTTGKSGILLAGGVEWMRAGAGVWHDGAPLPGAHLRGLQLWIALPAALEHAPAESQYVAPQSVPQEGPVRVILGRYGKAQSPVRAPSGVNYLDVRLKDGETWEYQAAAGHDVAWVYPYQGSLRAEGEPVARNELAVFEEGQSTLRFEAKGDTSFVLGSAVKHPHDLVLGYYSVHTSAKALAAGEAEIRRIGERLNLPMGVLA
ncbi:MAG TPA: pirin family protein [Burkholderiales bacterium]|nr:pirin family protein [Burkholderiales bacterium]